MNFMALVFPTVLLEHHELARGHGELGPGRRATHLASGWKRFLTAPLPAVSPTGLFTTIVFLRYLDGPAQSIFWELETEGMVPALRKSNHAVRANIMVGGVGPNDRALNFPHQNTMSQPYVAVCRMTSPKNAPTVTNMAVANNAKSPPSIINVKCVNGSVSQPRRASCALLSVRNSSDRLTATPKYSAIHRPGSTTLRNTFVSSR
jgi:hypothetical protein